MILIPFSASVGYYLSIYMSLLSKSKKLSTTINFSNILIALAVLILTFIQVVNIFTDKSNQANESKQPPQHYLSASYPSAPPDKNVTFRQALL